MDEFVAESESDLRPMHVEAYFASLRAGFANTFDGAVEEPAASGERPHIELLHAQPRLVKRSAMATRDATTGMTEVNYEVGCEIHYALRLTLNGQVHNIEARVQSEGSTAHRRGLSLLLRGALEAMLADIRGKVIELLAPPPDAEATESPDQAQQTSPASEP